MAIKITFNGATIVKPGAYSKTTVNQLAGAPLAPTGTVALIGEATGGAPGSSDGVQEFDSTQFDQIAATYLSGPLVDAAKAAINPSRDDAIVNGAQKLMIYKTNASTQSSRYVQNIDDANSGDGDNLFRAVSKNYGAGQNQIALSIAQGTVSDTQPNLVSGAITFPLTLTVAQTLVVRVAAIDYTFTVGAGDVGPHANVAALIALLNTDGNWAPSRPVTFMAGTTANTIKATLRTDQPTWDGYESQHEYGVMHIKGTGVELDTEFANTLAFASNGTAAGTFTVASVAGVSVGQFTRIVDNNTAEIEAVVTSITGSGPYTIEVNNGATDLTAYTTAQSARMYLNGAVISSALVVTEGAWGPTRGARGTRVFTVIRGGDSEVLDENDNDVRLIIQYVGASTGCTLSIVDSGSTKNLTTTTSGPSTPAEDLSIDLSTMTIQEVVNYINNFGGGGIYDCVTTYPNADVTAGTTLDVYNAINVERLPLNLKGAMKEIEDIVNNSSALINLSREDNIYGQLETISVPEFLSGGTLGATSNSNFQTGFDALLAVRANTVVPCISRDASDDISEGLTDPSSTYTIDAVNSQADTHARTASNTKNRSERLALVSKKDTFANTKIASKALNSEFSQMAFVDVDVIDLAGNRVTAQPYVGAAIGAGMRAGGPVGEALTFKYINILGVSHVDFNFKTQQDSAIEAGLLVVEHPDSGGFRFVLDNTTYNKDSNFVFNRGNVFSAAQYVAYDLRRYLEDIFVGNKVSSNNAVSVKSVASQRLLEYRDNEILVGDDTNKGLGYRDLTVVTTGNTTKISVVITPIQANEFMPISFVLDTIRQAA